MFETVGDYRSLPAPQANRMRGKPPSEHQAPLVRLMVELCDGKHKYRPEEARGRPSVPLHRVSSFLERGFHLHIDADISLIERAALAGTWTWEPGSRSIKGSPGLLPLLGLDSSSAAPSLECCLARFTPESRERLTAAVEKCGGSGQPWDLELQLGTLLGNARHLRSMGEPLVENDQIVAVHGVFVDIEPRRGAERAAAASDRQRRAMSDAVFLYAVTLSPEGSLLEVSDSALALLGSTREALVGQPLWMTPWWTYSGEIQMQLHAGIVCAAAGEHVRYEVEVMGTQGAVAIDLSIRPLLDAHGRVHGLVAEGLDISERRRIALALRHSEARLRVVFDQSPIGMAVAALDGRIKMANRALSDILGYPRIQLLSGMNLQQITLPVDLDPELDKMNLLLSGESQGYRIEKRLVHRSDRLVNVQLDVSLMRDDQDEPLHFMLHVQDIESRLAAQGSGLGEWRVGA